MTKTYKLVNNVVVETNVVETPFGRNATTGARWEPGPWPPSFDFVPPQVGALSIPVVDEDPEAMPASNGTGLIYNQTVGAFKQWNRTGGLTGTGGWDVVLSGQYMPNGADVNTIPTFGIWLIPNPDSTYAPPLPPGADITTSTLSVAAIGVFQFAGWDNDPSNTIYYRIIYQEGVTWGPWTAINGTQVHTTGVDLNTLMITGTYTISAAGSTNVPNGIINNNLVVEVFAAGGQIIQRLTAVYNPGEIYQRGHNDESGSMAWGPWYQITGTPA